MGCHMKQEGNPHEFTDWWRNRLGELRYQILLERKNDIGLGKLYRKTKGLGEIAKHYRGEFSRIQDCTDKQFEAFL